MMFTLLDHLLNGALIVAAVAMTAVFIDMACYAFGGDRDES